MRGCGVDIKGSSKEGYFTFEMATRLSEALQFLKTQKAYHYRRAYQAIMTAIAPLPCSYGSRKFSWYMRYIACGRIALEEGIRRRKEMDEFGFPHGSFTKLRTQRSDKILLKYPDHAQKAIM